MILQENNDAICEFFEYARDISNKYNVKFITGVKGQSLEMPELELEYIAV
jgi:hypothetical protein